MEILLRAKKKANRTLNGGERVRKIAKIGALILPLLLLTTALSAPVAAADSSSCSSCSSQNPCPTADNFTVNTENLDGFEERKAVVNAWTNKDTRLLMKELIRKDHCTPGLPESEAQEVIMNKNGEVLSRSTVVKIPFRAHGKDLDARIIHRDNGTSERAYATVTGTASVLEKPMEILKENAKYQAIVENLEEQGYSVKEEEAEVVKTYTPADYASVPSSIKDEVWNTATINVKAVKGDQVKNTTAIVCIDKDKVLAISDFDCFEICGAICASAASGVIGYTSCVGACSGLTGFWTVFGCSALCGALAYFGCGAGCGFICSQV